MKKSALTVASTALLLLSASNAGAWALFGTSMANAAGRLKSADRLLEKSEIALEEGDLSTASNGFVRLVEKYRDLAADYPEFEDGIAAIRLAYCEGKLAEMGVAQDAASETTTLSDAAPANDPESAADAYRAISGEEAPASTADSEETPREVAYNPRYLQYDFTEARDLVAKGRHGDALDILVPMVKFDPDNREIRMLLAMARLGAGQPDMAVATLEDLRGRRDDLPLLLLISAAYTSAGRYPEALLSLDDAIRLAPAEPDAFSNLAWLTLLMDGDTPEARTVADGYYKQALKRGAARDPALEGAIGAR